MGERRGINGGSPKETVQTGTLTAYSYIPTDGPCIDTMWHGLCPPGWLQLVSATRLGIRSTLNGENQEWRGYVMCDHTGT